MTHPQPDPQPDPQPSRPTSDPPTGGAPLLPGFAQVRQHRLVTGPLMGERTR